jgi:hypothetical protein
VGRKRQTERRLSCHLTCIKLKHFTTRRRKKQQQLMGTYKDKDAVKRKNSLPSNAIKI